MGAGEGRVHMAREDLADPHADTRGKVCDGLCKVLSYLMHFDLVYTPFLMRFEPLESCQSTLR